VINYVGYEVLALAIYTYVWKLTTHLLFHLLVDLHTYINRCQTIHVLKGINVWSSKVSAVAVVLIKDYSSDFDAATYIQI